MLSIDRVGGGVSSVWPSKGRPSCHMRVDMRPYRHLCIPEVNQNTANSVLTGQNGTWLEHRTKSRAGRGRTGLSRAGRGPAGFETGETKTPGTEAGVSEFRDKQRGDRSEAGRF